MGNKTSPMLHWSGDNEGILIFGWIYPLSVTQAEKHIEVFVFKSLSGAEMISFQILYFAKVFLLLAV